MSFLSKKSMIKAKTPRAITYLFLKKAGIWVRSFIRGLVIKLMILTIGN
jgi:hypothetical protein